MGLGDDDQHQRMIAEQRKLLQPFLDIAKRIPEDWPDEAHVRIEGYPDLQPPYSRMREAMDYWRGEQCENQILPTVGHFRAIVKAVEKWEGTGRG